MYQEYLIMTELGQLLDCYILPYNNTVTSMIDTFMSNNLLTIQDANLTGVMHRNASEFGQIQRVAYTFDLVSVISLCNNTCPNLYLENVPMGF